MSEWQPARLRISHQVPHDLMGVEYLTQEDIRAMLRKVVYVRRAEPSAQALQDYREEGCNAEIFYEIREDSLPEDSGCYACEHEILTD